MEQQRTLGEELVVQLQARGVTCVFGIPGVHTVELYRGVAESGLRHVTPRHEQGAGFMADGYARVSGKPGVAFVITGPGLTNILTPMAQARADSVPMFVVSGVNRSDTLGKGLGYLHELPDQHALARSVALKSYHLKGAGEVNAALTRGFLPFQQGRPGPVHIEIPLDVAAQQVKSTPTELQEAPQVPGKVAMDQAAELLQAARCPVILAGGGARWICEDLRHLAERLDAPVVQTVNGRGVVYDHPLSVPASPSLQSVRELIEAADIVLALGTELGPTDYDMYDTGSFPQIQRMIRVDRCAEQLARHRAQISICADAGQVVQQLLARIPGRTGHAQGVERARQTRAQAWEEIGPNYRHQVKILQALRDAVPNSVMVGDSTQPIYAGNLYYDHDRAGGWFNAATGYGALGYAIPASIGAAIAAPDTPVICLVGDGGAQFSLPEIMCAVDEKLPIRFVVWNNRGYGEIASSMAAAGVSVVGCDPSPPDFAATAASFGIPFQRVTSDPERVARALQNAPADGPMMVEILAPEAAHSQER